MGRTVTHYKTVVSGEVKLSEHPDYKCQRDWGGREGGGGRKEEGREGEREEEREGGREGGKSGECFITAGNTVI